MVSRYDPEGAHRRQRSMEEGQKALERIEPDTGSSQRGGNSVSATAAHIEHMGDGRRARL